MQMPTVNRIEPRKTKADVLHRLLALEPETMGQLLTCTGWPRAEVEGALNELIAQQKVAPTRLDRGVAYRCIQYPVFNSSIRG